MVSTSGDVVTAMNDSFSVISARLTAFAPRIIVAGIFVILGWIIALIVGNIIATVAQTLGFDALSRKIGLTRLLESANIEKNVSAIIGQLTTWILMIVVFMGASEAMGIQSVELFFNQLLGYVPDVIGAMAMLLVGLVLANFLSDTVRHVVQASGLGHTSVLTVLTRNVVVTFTVIAVMAQLGIAPMVMNTLVIGFIAMIAIAGGLAFGIGGQGTAKRILEGVESQLSAKKK